MDYAKRILKQIDCKMVLFVLYFSFPVVDYLLRSVLGIPILGSLWDELVLVAFLLLLAWYWFMGDIDINELQKIDVTKPLLLMVVYGVALVFFNIPYFAVGVEGFRASFQYIFAFFVAFFLMREHKIVMMMLYVVVGIGFIMGLHGVYQYIAGVPMLGQWVDAGENVRTRAFSIVGSPNVLGSFMAFTTFLALGLVLYYLQLSNLINYFKKNSGGELFGVYYFTLAVFFLFASAVMSLCLLLTFSRGALLAFALSFVIVATVFAFIYDKRYIIAVAVMGILGVIAIYILSPTVVERLLYVFSPEYFEKSAQGGRITRWLNAFDRMRHEPFFGAGLGQYGGAVGARHFSTIYVDNYYAKTWAEMGLVGIGLFMWLIFALLKNAYQAWITLWQTNYRFIAAGLFGALLAIILHNGVENIFEVPFMNVLFWMSAGCLLGMWREGGLRDETK